MRTSVEQRASGAARVAGVLVSILLIAAMVSGCTAGGRALAPTAQPPRLLDPTAPAQATAAAPAPTGQATAAPTAQATTAPTGQATQIAPAPTTQPTPAPAGTLVLIGLVELIAGELWTIDGIVVRVPAALVVAPELGLGRLVRVVLRDDDDDDDDNLVVVRIEAVRQAPIVGQIIALDATTLVLDDRRLVIPVGLVLPPGLAPGALVRVVVDDDGGALVVRVVEPLVEAQIIGGTVELIGPELIIISGQRLRLAPELVLWRVRPVVGQPIRVIVLPRDGVLTIVTITIVTIIVPPPVVVVPPPPPVVVVPPPPSGGGGGGGGGGDDDDDDD